MSAHIDPVTPFNALARENERLRAERDALADALREVRDTIVPHPYSPQFLKDIARAALDRQEQR